MVDEALGLVGRCDVVDIRDDGVRVIEFKAAPLRRRAEVTLAQEVQLALQGLCLESMGHPVVGYGVYFTTQRK
ncbi:MAG: PD-(D/E)XK nuclease family protein, partial [Actinomycetota bacterium]|nr:PD-(D/E)XK nuclease family protein [Actinomycetota bacterium]